MKNIEVARLLYQIADILELQEVKFKPQAYRKAAMNIEALSEDIEEIHQAGKLEDIPGVGKGIAEKIIEFFEKGKSVYLEKLKKELPIDLEGLNQVQGLGPKTIKLLYKELHIKNIYDLEKAAKQGKIQKITGLGLTTEQNILKEIERVKAQPHRMLLGHAYPIAMELKRRFASLKFVKQVEIAGSFRRGKETVGDLDVLVISDNHQQVMDFFTTMKDVKEVVAKGTTRGAIRLDNGLDVDIRILHPNEFGSALLYFTGNKLHNIELRKLALQKGYTLSEYGLFTLKGKKRIAGKTEVDIYRKLGLQYIPPELREDIGEIPLAQQKKIPILVEEKDVQGDFQTQTTWSDGSHAIAEMAKKAQQLGWKYMAVTDHVGAIGVAHPLDRKMILQQSKEIDKLNKTSPVRILKGAEIDILKDGSLAMDKKTLQELDIVLASVHSAFKMSEAEMTKRIIHTLENYPVTILAHPTGRRISYREPYAVNIEKVAEVAKERGIFLEINGQPERIDLNDINIRTAKEVGCQFSLGSDAHSVPDLEFMKFAVITARRGGLTKEKILNCWPLKKVEKVLEQ